MVPGVAPGSGYMVALGVASLVMVWACNLYNFMDGSDGLAGAMTVIGFAALGIASSDGALRIAALALAAACLPFLAVNRPPARIFLGDVGAVPIGFLAGAFGIGGVVGGAWPAWFPLLVFLPFVADATATLVRRLVRGERVWQAHRSHYYQRLHQLGAGHAGTFAVYVAAALACALTALGCLAYAPAAGLAALAAWCVAFAVLFAAIDYHWRRKPSATR
jgi:UDP-N-acetylmuramyl pentapeptide phosphotransferase/UDP-N-acetylglucosamine-1-phosphate transferase